MVSTMPHKIASAATYCISGTLVCGGSVMQWLHELDWNLIAVISGILIGVATFLSNLYFKCRQTRAYEAAIKKGIVAPPPWKGD